ncbi:MAG: hypothetical protein JJU11_02580 [Candidatus Sumerlaeia bacterium]|nr:hypothetical protein [Candidatus Sumerlaeia bacterium]
MNFRGILIQSRWGALALFLFVVGLGLLFFHGQLESSDEVLMAATSVSLADRGSLRFTEPIYDHYFSGYGLGMPLVGIPPHLLQRGLGFIGVIDENAPALFNLAPVILSGIALVFLGGFLGGQRRWAYLGLVLLACPLLAAAQRFYSEMLLAAALAVLFCLFEKGRHSRPSPKLIVLMGVGVFLAACLAMLSRIAALPFLLLALVWGWRHGTKWTFLLPALGGILAGGAITMLQNIALWGGPFETGYKGQNFTTPLGTGAYALLFSTERGALIFFPALLVPLLGWKHLGGPQRRLTVAAVALTLFSICFHGVFWTWHGGWTAGPRFLLPVLILFIPGIARVVSRWRHLVFPLKLFVVVSIAWGIMMNWIYLQHSPMHWWRLTWGFHLIENKFLFMPQMSLWQAWMEGVPLPRLTSVLPPAWSLFFTAMGITFVAVSLYPLLVPFRGHTGISGKAALKPVEFRGIRPAPLQVAILGVVFLLLAATKWFSGPRGWEVIGAGFYAERPSHLLLDGQQGTFRGWLDYPLATPMRLHLRGAGPYRVTVNGETIFEDGDVGPPRLSRADLNLSPGLHQIEVQVLPRPQGAPSRIELFWSWGGEGRFMTPAGGEYLLPRPLTASEQFFTRIWRRKEILLGAVLALLLLMKGGASAFLQSLPLGRNNSAVSR